MPGILLVAATTGYQTRAFADAARRLGLALTLATDRCHILENPWGDDAVPVRFDAPAEAAAALAEALRGRQIAGIAAVADRPAVVAAFTAERLGLRWHSSAAVSVCRNKFRMRELFASAGLPVPWFGLAEADASGPRRYPCVLKPLGLSGSRGVIRADNDTEYDAALRRIRRIVGPAEAIQVEEYIPGREFALEGLMTDGQLQTLAIFDKPDPLVGPLFEETIYVTPSRQPAAIQRDIAETCVRACRALGLSHGPVHAEMRVNGDAVYMLEIAARPIGGLCARAVRFQMPLEELILLHAIGEAPRDLKPARPASGVMMIPVPRAGVLQSVSGIEEGLAVPGIDDIVITAKRGETLVPLPEGASYPGFIFASGEDAGSVERALRTAHGALRFDILAALTRIF